MKEELVGTVDGLEAKTEEIGGINKHSKVSCWSSVLEMLIVGGAEKGGAWEEQYELAKELTL